MRVKTAMRNYQWDILTNIVEPINQIMFLNSPWIFQKDFAPAHKAKTMQQLLENHVPKLISRDHWPSSSPDLIQLSTNCGQFSWSVQDVTII